MIMVAFGCSVRPLPPCFDGLTGGMSRDQAVALASDQVAATGLEKGLVDQEVVLRLEELHQGPLHPPVTQAPRDVDLLAADRVDPGVIQAGRDVRGHE